jgi:hypothetical protein
MTISTSAFTNSDVLVTDYVVGALVTLRPQAREPRVRGVKMTHTKGAPRRAYHSHFALPHESPQGWEVKERAFQVDP